jgi:AcrR family transcriptional regulator
MSLYRHVLSKDDLLDDVVDTLLAKAWRPTKDPSDWKGFVGEAAENLRRLLVSQPVALYVFLAHPVVSPAAVERMTAVMDVLRGATSDEESARGAYAAIHTYTLGFASLEASRARWTPPQGDSNSTQLAAELSSYTTSSQFALGLRYLMEGVERRPTATPA